ncbi:MAG: divalent metal cation transporter [Planctomycetia bacterium]|nr:divalent metal cation transporter [Planctomycetia bacterium]
MAKEKQNWSLLLGAAFLMATSAIGPGFLTQTSLFTDQFRANFAFVIFASILLDIGAQVNVWRIIIVSECRAQDLANALLPGLGYFLAGLLVLGGLAFNVGNVAGCGLALNVLFGIPVQLGAVLSAAVAVILFLSKQANRAMDRCAQGLGFLMIALTMYVAASARPPVGEALAHTLIPAVEANQQAAFLLAIVTLVGGTVGGYITFAGAHRLLDGNVKGASALPQVTRSSVSGILVTAVMRTLLFLAVLGVVSQGHRLDPDNPPASVFRLAAGNVGYKLFGIVLWAAAITSVAGSAYTSVSFIRTFSKRVETHHRWVIIGFVMLSTIIFVAFGKPVRVLVLAGALNGLILPVALAVILIAGNSKRLVGGYRHPVWMTTVGVVVVVIMACLGAITLYFELPKLLR